MISSTTALTAAIRATVPGHILVVTGAGVSLASGIPTFRGTDRDAIWKRDVMELGTLRFFQEDPVGSWQWYLSRFEKVAGARPNPGHHAIAALEQFQVARGGDFLLVTQNIDTLHEQAGSRRLVKVHGSSDRYRCVRPGCELGAPSGSVAAADVDLATFRAEPTHATLPRCPACGGLLRIHVLWFDEYYDGHRDYRWDRVVESASVHADLVIFVGTSFAVGVTDLVLQAALSRRVPVFSIDPTPRVGAGVVHSIAAPSELALAEVLAALGTEPDETSA